MSKIILNSDSKIAERKPEKRTTFATGRPGLLIRCSKTAKTFIWFYKVKQPDGTNKVKQITIGTFPGMSLNQAAVELDALKKMHAAGIDPGATEPVKEVETMNDLMDDFDELQLTERESPTAARQVMKKDLRRALGNIKLADLTPDLLRKPIRAAIKRNSRSQAVTILKLTKQMISWGFRMDHLTINHAAKISLKDMGLKKTSGYSRARTPTVDEVVELWHAVDALPKSRVRIKNLLKLLFVTGCRTREWRLGKWTDIDWENQTYTIPVERRKSRNQVKGLQDFILPLTPLALMMLREIEADHPGGEFIFPALNVRRPSDVIEPNSLHSLCRRLRKKIDTSRAERGLTPRENWTPHDSRRFVSASLSGLGTDSAVIEMCLGHSLGRIFNTYQTGDPFEARKQALLAHDARLKKHLFQDANALVV